MLKTLIFLATICAQIVMAQVVTPQNTENKESDKDKKYDLLFVGQISPIKNTPYQYTYYSHYLYASEINRWKKFDLQNITTEDLNEEISNGNGARLKNLVNALVVGWSTFYNPSTDKDDYTSSKIAMEWAANHVSQLHLSHDELNEVTARIMELLNHNYLDSRNQTSQADNEHRYATRYAYSIINNKPQDGGVCDDIATIGCELIKRVTPERDCLILGYNGPGVFHEVVAVGDGRSNYTVINYGDVKNVKDRAYLSSLDNKASGEFVRVQKVTDDGRLKDLYLLRNEYGEWVEKLRNGETNSNLNANNSESASLLFVKEFAKQTKSVGVHQAYFSDSSVAVAVVAEIDHTKQGSKSGFDLSGMLSYQFGTVDQDDFEVYSTKTRLGVSASYLKILPLYVKNGLSIKSYGKAGINLMGGGSHHENINKGYTSSGIAFDGTQYLEAGIKLQALSENKKTSLMAQLNERLDIGSSDYSGMHGIISSGKEFWQALGKLRFHHQELNVNANLNHQLGEKWSVAASGEYLGTNIGQLYYVGAGPNVKLPSGVKIHVLVGYSGTAAGYQTNNNWLSKRANEGFSTQVDVETKSGAKFNARYASQGFSGVSAKIPLGKKTSKK